jgi:hypothetical protein
VVALGTATGVTLRNVNVVAGDHSALRLDQATSAEYRLYDCSFENTSTTAHTLLEDGLGAFASTFARFVNCTFKDNAQLGNSVASLAFASDTRAHFVQFDKCRFESATFSTVPCGIFKHCKFYNCYFEFTGANIPGDDESIVDGLWRFEGEKSTVAGTIDGRCTVQDVTFDFGDKEVIDNSFGDPVFEGAYVEIKRGDLINPQFIGLSRYGLRDAGTPGGSVLRLEVDSTLDRATFEWTSTAFIQGGTGPSDGGWIRVVNSDVTVKNVHLIDVAPAAYTNAVVMLGVDNSSLERFTLSDCTFSEGNGAASALFLATTPSGSGHTNWQWHNVSFGDTAGMLATFPLPIGSGCKINNCTFEFAYAATASDISLGAASGSGRINFTGNTVISTVATDGSAKAPFAVLSVDLDDSIFCNNLIFYTDSGANARDLFGGAPASAANFVAVGNVFINAFPGVGTADGSITIVTPNVGIP